MKILFEDIVVENFTQRFTELLNEYKSTNGTYEQLAKELGIKSKSNITKYSNGSIIVNLTMFAKICDFFKVSPIWLLGLENDRNYEYKKMNTTTE